MFHVVFILLASFPFFKSENTELFGSKDMLNCVENIYIMWSIWYNSVNTISQHKIWRSCSHNLAKTWLVFAYIKWQKYNCFAWDINNLFTNPVACSNHYWFPSFFTRRKYSGWNQSRKKRLLTAGYFFPGLCFNSVYRRMVYLIRVTFEKEIPVSYFRFTHLSWLSRNRFVSFFKLVTR